MGEGAGSESDWGGWALDTPVAMVVFNRTEKARRVFETVASIEPRELFVIADGPRADHPEDKERCAETRAVVEDVDWDCEVRRNYADENLGIAERIPTGLDWVFEHVQEAIILEDDCLPDPSFFPFCQRLLETYRDDERVWEVTGTNPFGEWRHERYDYHFAIHGMVWGWATWRDAWEAYDPAMQRWSDPDMRSRVRDHLADDRQYRWVERLYDRTYRGEENTWDYQWGFAKAINSGLSIVPSRNLVTNIGFDEDATNTTTDVSPLAGVPRRSYDEPIRLNDFVVVDREYNRRYYERATSNWERNRLLRRLRSLYFRYDKPLYRYLERLW